MIAFRMAPVLENLSVTFRLALITFYVLAILITLRYGITILVRGMRWWDIEQSPLFTLLKEYPHHIVWIFETPSKDKRQELTVNVWLADGEKYRLFVKEDDKDPLIQALSRFAPKARLGYQPEWVKEYKQDPSIFGAIPIADIRKSTGGNTNAHFF